MGWDVLIFPNLCSLMYFACIIEEIKCKYCSFSLTVGREKKNGKKKKGSNTVLQTSLVLDGLKLLLHQCSCDTESVSWAPGSFVYKRLHCESGPLFFGGGCCCYLFISSRNNIRVSN